MKKNFTKLSVCALLLCGSGMYAQTDSTTTGSAETDALVEDDFFDLSLEDLANIEVTSVSKKAERLQDVAASMYVLTQEDIKKSSATTIHELLREVPGYWGVQDEYNNVTSGMRVSQTAQGANQGTVLYLLDGTPIQDQMSSTFTNRNFDIPLDEIDRIEIIKGSGGVIYGANSATGVVNIFTKAADKYDGLHARVEGAAPGYGNATLRAGGKVTDRLSVSGYGKARYMEGYGLMDEFDGETVTVPKNDGSGDTIITNRFTENFEKSISFALGLKLKYELSDKTSLSLNTHFNTMQKGHYSSYYEPIFVTGLNDQKVYKKANHNRLVSNIRLDHQFTDNHSVFVRVSNNHEADYTKLGGGYQVNNGMIDIEAQDNLTLGIQDLSFGGNVRFVSFDVHDINDKNTINYIDPQSNQTLAGFFIQDKIRLIENKLDLLLGAKGETYSLINDKVYFSPMAKASFRPTQKVTLWGGFTQSYTTPGYNNTNIDLNLVTFNPLLPPSPQTTNVGVKNGSTTVPTKYQTAEFGLKAKILEKIQFESNFFYSWITDGIAVSENPIGVEESPTRPGTMTAYYAYGNYVKGTTHGTETFVRYRPKKEIMFELSHTWLQSEWEYQKNDDFDVDQLSDDVRDRTPEVSKTPRHVWRIRGWYDFAKVYSFSASVIYGTKFSTQGNYQYPEQRYVSPIGGQLGQSGTTVSKNADRGIVNLRFERTFSEEKLSIYIFGNDVFNNGSIANTNDITNTTLSKIGGMYGLGAILKIK